MDRTLYLNEKKGLEVTRDGPSIWIKEDGRAGRRIPARLIGHVIIIGNIKIDAGTITLFTDNNIPVTFMSRRGNEVAVTIPYNHHFNSHYDEQKSILERDENIDRYRQWLIAERRRMQLKVVKKLSRDVASVYMSHGFREQNYGDFVKRYASVAEKRWKVVNAVISNMLSEMVLRNIIKADLDPHLGIINRRHNFGMVLDIFYTMEPEADLQTIQLFKSGNTGEYLILSSTGWTLTRDGMRDVVQRFENKKKLINMLIENVIDGLFETIRALRI